jgi:hypothetical protein
MLGKKINLQTLRIRRRHFDFLINVFNGIKCFPSVLETVGKRVHTWNSARSVAPSAEYVSAANAVYKRTDIFNNSCSSIKSLSFFICFVLCCLIAAVCIRADSVIGHWLLSSARN